MVAWYNDFSFSPETRHFTIKRRFVRGGKSALDTQELQPVWPQFVDLHRLRGIALRGTSSRCVLRHSFSEFRHPTLSIINASSHGISHDLGSPTCISVALSNDDLVLDGESTQMIRVCSVHGKRFKWFLQLA